MNNESSKNKYRFHQIVWVCIHIILLAIIISGCASKLTRAISKGDEVALKEYLQKEDYSSEDLYVPLIEAIRKENSRIVESLIANGADVNFYIETRSLDDRAFPPVFEAIRVDNIEILKILMDHGADLTSKSPLIRLSSYDKIVEEDKPLPNHVNDITALEWAIYLGRTDVVKFLIDSGVKVHPDSTTYFFTALLWGKIKTAEYLLDNVIRIPSSILPLVYCQAGLWISRANSIDGINQNPENPWIIDSPGFYQIDFNYYRYHSDILYSEYSTEPSTIFLNVRLETIYFIHPEFLEDGEWRVGVKEMIIRQ